MQDVTHSEISSQLRAVIPVKAQTEPIQIKIIQLIQVNPCKYGQYPANKTNTYYAQIANNLGKKVERICIEKQFSAPFGNKIVRFGTFRRHLAPQRIHAPQRANRIYGGKK
jgi:hypothetical protein